MINVRLPNHSTVWMNEAILDRLVRNRKTKEATPEKQWIVITTCFLISSYNDIELNNINCILLLYYRNYNIFL